MSALRLSSVRVPFTKSLSGSIARRSFQSSTRLAAGRESDLHVENKAETIEYHKQEQVRKQKEGKGHWHEEIASDSESIVKADRGEIKDAKATIEKLQEDTAKAAQEEKDRK